MRIQLRLAAPLFAATLTFSGSLFSAPASGNSLAIYAQTDSRAEFRPCHCPGAEMSGFATRAGIFRMARAQRIPVMFLDGGDFVPAPEDTLVPERAALMIEAMSLMQYHAVAVGELELFRGRDYLAEAANRLPLVSSNLTVLGDDGPEVPTARRLDLDGQRVAVVSFLDPLLFYSLPGVFKNQAKDFLLSDPVEALEPVLDEVRPDADLVVLLAHAAWPEVERVLGELTGIDVAVVGHEPDSSVPAMKHEGVLVMIPGERSRQVAQLTLNRGGDGSYSEKLSRMWDLIKVDRGDDRVDALVREFEERHGRQ